MLMKPQAMNAVGNKTQKVTGEWNQFRCAHQLDSFSLLDEYILDDI